uniref:UBX domain-containing protein n=1 Tax=Mesocestoides corti TaxID=53468 RepID=A0A5K3EJD4_MESCO
VTLELVACEECPSGQGSSSSLVPVRIGFRLEDGHRTEWSGPSHSSIWSILETLATQDERIASMLQVTPEGLVPTIIYIQQQIGGEQALRETTIESLGIRGPVLFKLDHRPPPPPSNKSAKLTASAQSSVATVPTSTAPSTSSARTDNLVPQSSSAASQLTYSQHLPQGESASIIFPPEAGGSLSNEPFSIFGTRPARSIFDSSAPAQRKYERPLTIGELIGVNLEPDDETTSQRATVPEHLRNFRFPTETEGQNLMDTDDTPGTSNYGCSPCEREDLIFQRITTETIDTGPELPDEFFQLTENELRRIIADLRKAAGTDAVLGEQNIQSAARRRLYSRYPRCIIKFIWSDDVVLQACFKPLENVSALYEFIRDRLADTSVDFQLFTTPPRVNLSNMSHSLIEAQLFPMAIVHMTTRNGSPKARDILRPDVLEAINTKSAAQANEITSKWMARKASS